MVALIVNSEGCDDGANNKKIYLSRINTIADCYEISLKLYECVTFVVEAPCVVVFCITVCWIIVRGVVSEPVAEEEGVIVPLFTEAVLTVYN